jgi:hypothetical protein
MKKKPSRQRLYQIAHARKGLCAKCPEPAQAGSLCLKHAVAYREYQRSRLGSKRKNNSLTRRLQAEAKQ